ncbi:MAG: glycosyltransferase family 92 protein [Chlamydiales bacterium]|nr:glycosyltransferase family 92 protein [Chlamydiia bacterium]MCP5507383.1 glycosyltransferase family 92 protein [Chlamydiales bacterium]
MKKLFLFLLLALQLPLNAGIKDAINHHDVKLAITENRQYSVNIAITAIFRDEARFLKEWIDFHRLIGVERFYLYNNLSCDDYAAVLAPYVAAGIVTLVEWPHESIGLGDWNNIQTTAYRDAMNRARIEKVRWLAVIDVDEFIVPTIHHTLTDLLEEHRHACAVRVNWVFFGTSHVTEIPKNKLMIEMLTRNSGYVGESQGYKAILHTGRCETAGPHDGLYNDGFAPIWLPYATAQINHYWSRDEKHFYQVKVPRRIKLNQSVATSEEWVDNWNKEIPEAALPIQCYIHDLRLLMGMPNE